MSTSLASSPPLPSNPLPGFDTPQETAASGAGEVSERQGCSMHSFWLTFNNSALEGQFNRYMVQRHWKVDGVFIWTSGCVIVIYLLRTIREGLQAPILPMVVNLLNVMVVIWLRRSRGVSGMLAWRSTLIMCSRLLGYCGFALVHPKLVWRFEKTQSRLVSFLELLNAHHVLGALFPAIGFKLKFTHHFYTRILETGVFLFMQVRKVCHNILEHPNKDHVTEIERIVDSSLHNLLRMFYSLIGLPDIPRNEKKSCYHLAYYIHILWSFGVVTYVTWRLERCSRVFFLNSLGAEHVPPTGPRERAITPAQDFYNFVVFISLCCLLWEFMAVLNIKM